ncbi:FAD-dependent oxidoreductase [Mitsuaria sp. 7]|uniref:FAD-dependent oxidoreductase n=1 Tax=Mitsuaria sp. 7 TaxID=1658665 RepID=UPI0007DE3501|nr:FAD-dependent oxidoreductase [Mitsuaria sp. 7]ANH67109.1 2-polyprenyl-6-methoxyphenol hydroxylase [Mitsuaria sp. 7]
MNESILPGALPGTLPDTTQVLIVGAGAAGLTLAIDLARRGVDFQLIEQASQPFHGSRGKGIQPRTQEVLEDLGLLERLVATGGPYPPQRHHAADGSVTETAFETSPPTSAEPHQMALMVPQFLTEAAMRERLAELGHAPRYGCALVDFEQDEEGVTARVAVGADGNGGAVRQKRIRARYLVGADGGRSDVRKQLGIEFPGKTLGVRAVVADVTLTGLPRDAWHQFNDGSMARQLALCPLAGTALFQLQAPVPLEGEVDLGVDGLNAMVKDRSGRDDIRIEAVYWASAYNMNARLADRYRVGRVFLVGDAAHIHPPTGGQGLNTSVQDAYNLGWKLGAVLRGAPDALLDTYEEERRPVAEGVLKLSSRLLDAAKRGDNRRGRDVHQLDIGYPDSSLALEAPARERGLLAGDRAPDARLRGAAGQGSRLFELFRGPQWTLLAYGTSRTALNSLGLVPARAGLRIHAIGEAGDGGDYVDEHGDLRNAYAPQVGDWILVRPDGYVAAIVGEGALDALERFMAACGLQRP